MLKALAAASVLLLTACNSMLFPGLMSVPHLHEKGDVQLAANAAVFGGVAGNAAQVAYAFTDHWGVLATAGDLTSMNSYNNRKNDRISYYELGVMRMFGPDIDYPLSTTYSLQLGFGRARSSLLNRETPGLNFYQNHVYAQANSRHLLSDEISISFGFRLGASSLTWLGTAPIAFLTPGYGTSSVKRAIDIINYQPIYFMASPVFQAEYLFRRFAFGLTMHPSYIFNQAYPEMPTTPFNIGVRWNLKG
jgi:hypothetical protein